MIFSVFDTPSFSAYFIAFQTDNFSAIHFHFTQFVRISVAERQKRVCSFLFCKKNVRSRIFIQVESNASSAQLKITKEGIFIEHKNFGRTVVCSGRFQIIRRVYVARQNTVRKECIIGRSRCGQKNVRCTVYADNKKIVY